MANLGSNNTPISGESFDLPSGWSFEENVDGEVVITDSGGATIGRRDETNGEWVFDSIVGDTLEALDATITGSYATEADLPSGLNKGAIAYVEDEDALYVEDET